MSKHRFVFNGESSHTQSGISVHGMIDFRKI